MGRPRGSKNRSTILREAQAAMVARGLLDHEQDFLDSLAVMEEIYAALLAKRRLQQEGDRRL